MTQPTWLALGDSYTIGEGVHPEERWPAQLAQQHRLAEPEYLAETGWTTVDLLEAMSHADFAKHYGWVSVQIGVNDQYDGLGTEEYRDNLNKILNFAVHKVADPSHAIVLSIPDYSVTTFAKNKQPERIAREIVLFNTIAEELAAVKHATYCDITELSQRAANDPALLAEDELHLSGKMYGLWVEKLSGEVFRGKISS